MLRTTLALLTLLTLAIVAPGCGNTAVVDPIEGTFTLDDISGVYDGLGGVHRFGETNCPQDVGFVTLTNNGTTDMELDVTIDSSQIDIYYVDPTTDARSPWVPTTISGSEEVEVAVQFDCSATTDVSSQLVFHAGPAGVTPLEHTLPFTLDIQGAP